MGEKTEKATSKKRSDERKKGNVFQSKDVITVASIFIMFTFLKYYFPVIYNTGASALYSAMELMETTTEMTQALQTQIFKDLFRNAIVAIFPVSIMAILVAVVVTGSQTRFLFSMQAMKPKFSKLNPLKGIANMVSLKSLVELVKNLLKVTILAYILYAFISERYSNFLKMLDIDIVKAIEYLFTTILDMASQVVLIFIVIAAFDFLYQKWKYEKDMKMSKQEVKEEYKQIEGDPKVKQKIKERQSSMARARMMQAVPTADVIIRNPTHFAVALKYDSEKNDAPIVVAKGQDNIALKIVEIGEKNGVYTIENKPLARAIYAEAEINSTIPFEYFAAIAEILALVYKIKGKTGEYL